MTARKSTLTCSVKFTCIDERIIINKIRRPPVSGNIEPPCQGKATEETRFLNLIKSCMVRSRVYALDVIFYEDSCFCKISPFVGLFRFLWDDQMNQVLTRTG